MSWFIQNRAGQAILLACGIGAGLTGLLARGIALDATHPALTALILGLFALTTTLMAFSSLVALAGLRVPSGSDASLAETPSGRCAILWLICGEPAEPVAERAAALIQGLDATGQAQDCDIFILSDTSDPQARALEQALFGPMAARLHYRNRTQPVGKKPGNLQDWLDQHGQAYETMLILDADSGFSADRLADLRAMMASDPKLGLVQAGLRLRPGSSRFAALQRLSARLSGPAFARGLARISEESGNFWGHNALLRVRAFAQIAPLPPLPGRAPMGGPILSHDFIEAAWLRRAGWHVRICPDSRGSFEDGPDSIDAHLRRDRRWAQGNLQHTRLILGAGLHPTSRLHLATGILAYLAAPIWLTLVLLTGSGAVHVTPGLFWPLSGVALLLLMPKLAGLLSRRSALRRRRRRRVLLRALWAELGQSTLFAPIGMVRRTGFVLQILSGRSVPWVPSGATRGMQATGPGRPEALAGAAIIAAVALPQWLIIGPGAAALAGLLVLPVTGPLLAAPLLWRWFDAARPAQEPVAEYYDRSTRRFLSIGGSGSALAIHRPLWADGVTNPVAASAHVNTVIAAQAVAALGRAPSQVIDLGCGVGGTLFHLARDWPDARMTGVTLSGEQVSIAQSHAQARGLSDRVGFLRSNFLLPTTLPRADLAVAIESHVHAPDAHSFLHAALAHLRPGGVLVLVDDMLCAPEADLTRAQRQRLDQFRRGWRLGHVPDRDSLIATAQRLGYEPVSMQDLTPLLRLDRWRDRALRLAGPFADQMGLAHLPVFGNMIGGNALTESYRAGAMRYTCITLRSPVAGVIPFDLNEAVA
jgi:SAM-dependent methyltransferase